MKYVFRKEKDGYEFRTMIRDNDPEDMAEYGLPAGPPDTREIYWEGVALEINRIMNEFGMFTWADAQRNVAGMTAIMNVVKREVIQKYKLQDTELNDSNNKE